MFSFLKTQFQFRTKSHDVDVVTHRRERVETLNYNSHSLADAASDCSLRCWPPHFPLSAPQSPSNMSNLVLSSARCTLAHSQTHSHAYAHALARTLKTCTKCAMSARHFHQAHQFGLYTLSTNTQSVLRVRSWHIHKPSQMRPYIADSLIKDRQHRFDAADARRSRVQRFVLQFECM